MADMTDKMKLRADLIAILNKYRDASQLDGIEVNNDIDYLSKIDDKVLNRFIG